MGDALAWVGQVFEWLGKFIPRWEIVEVQVQGVKYVGGKKVVICPPGIHWWWPVTTKWETHQVVRQADELQSQTIVTADDKTIAVSGLLVYRVTDLATLVTNAYAPMELVQDIALTAVHDVCCSMTWEELKGEQRKGTLDTKLRNAAKNQLKEYGVDVVKCMLTDLAPARVIKLIQPKHM